MQSLSHDEIRRLIASEPAKELHLYPVEETHQIGYSHPVEALYETERLDLKVYGTAILFGVQSDGTPLLTSPELKHVDIADKESDFKTTLYFSEPLHRCAWVSQWNKNHQAIVPHLNLNAVYQHECETQFAKLISFRLALSDPENTKQLLVLPNENGMIVEEDLSAHLFIGRKDGKQLICSCTTRISEEDARANLPLAQCVRTLKQKTDPISKGLLAKQLGAHEQHPCLSTLFVMDEDFQRAFDEARPHISIDAHTDWDFEQDLKHSLAQLTQQRQQLIDRFPTDLEEAENIRFVFKQGDQAPINNRESCCLTADVDEGKYQLEFAGTIEDITQAQRDWQSSDDFTLTHQNHTYRFKLSDDNALCEILREYLPEWLSEVGSGNALTNLCQTTPKSERA